MYFNRWDVCEAYALYDMLWGPTPYGARLHRIGYRSSVLASLERADENVKAIYGKLVRERNRLYIAFSRYQKRAPHAPQWPGTYNMPRGDVRGWLASAGILHAVETYA